MPSEPSMTPEIERLKADVSSGTALTVEQRAYLLSLIERDSWIPVEEQEPPPGVEVEIMGTAVHGSDGGFFKYVERMSFTHWRPLPPAPEEKL